MHRMTIMNFKCLIANSSVRKLDKLKQFGACLLVLFVGFSSALAGEQKLIKITTQKQIDATEFYVENLQYADVTVTLEVDLKNLTASEKLPLTATIPARSKVGVFNVLAIDPKQDSSWSYTYYAT